MTVPFAFSTRRAAQQLDAAYRTPLRLAAVGLLLLCSAVLATAAEAQALPTSVDAMLANELRLAGQLEHAQPPPSPPRSLQAAVRRARGGPDAAPPETDLHATPWGTVGRARHRFLTMQVTGYAMAAVAGVFGLAGGLIRRRCDGPELDTSDRNPLPYVAVPIFGLGLTTGLIGSLRTRRLLREHGNVARDRTAKGPFLAGFVAALVLGGLGGTVAMASLCYG